MSNQRITELERTKFLLVLNGYAYFQALAAACELGLFTYLSEHPDQTLKSISRRLKITPYATRVLLLAGCALGLLNRDERNETHSNTPISEKYLVSTSPESLVPFIKQGFMIQEPGCRYFLESLKAGTNTGLKAFPGSGKTLYQKIAGNRELERVFHEGMAQFTKQTNEVLTNLKVLGGVKHLADVGGGDGTNAKMLHKAFPNLKITVFDLPSVAKIAKQTVSREKLSDTITVHPGDAFVDPLPSNIDAILFSHFLEIFSEEKIQQLYKKAYRALPENGKLIAWTLSCNATETGTLQSAKSSIYFLAVASGEGMTYPAQDHEKWLRAAGFSKVRRSRKGEHALIIATK
jgi:ubiquinone/menaquinone biosynthesis C-methylase UbiE